MRRSFLFMFVFYVFASCFQIFASYPLVRNFSKKASNAAAQNWAIAQYKNNWMYFANNKGLLEYDGDRWTVYPIRNYTNVRSIKYDSIQDRIYAGAFNEFGYYQRTNKGFLTYVSLSEKLKSSDSQFTEIWNISATEDAFYFQSDNEVFCYQDSSLNRFHFDENISFSAVVHNLMVVSTLKRGVLYLNGDIFMAFPNSEILKNKKVCAILPYQNNKILFVTDFNGIFLFNGEKIVPFVTDMDEFMQQNQVFCAAINQDVLAVGTVRNGLLVKNLHDNSNIFSNTHTGLQNNTVLSISFDKTGNLWLGLDKGIDYVMINSPIYDYFGNTILYGAGYASLLHQGSLFLGTNQGLYVKSFGNESVHSAIRTVAGIQGQIWSVQQIDGTVFCASDHGAYIVSKDFHATKIAGTSGTWGFQQMRDHPNLILGSSYQGFYIIEKRAGKWSFSHYIKGFDETGGMFVEDTEGRVWITHWMKGVYRLTFNSQLDSISKIDFYGVEKGFPSTHNNTVFREGNNIIFSTENGFFQYNAKIDSVDNSPFFSSLFNVPGSSVKIYASEYGDYWCVSGSRVQAAFRNENGEYKVDSSSFLTMKDKLIPGFEHLSFLDSTQVLIGTEDGFSIIDRKRLNEMENESLGLAIRNVFVTNSHDSIVNGYVQNSESIQVFDSKHNSIRFEYVGTEFRNEQSLLYSYMLENYETEWSEFSTVNTKEYTKLPSGTYTFKVRAHNLYDLKSAETSFTFTILAPWYMSKFAFMVYGLLSLVALYFFVRYIRFRSEEGARRMEVHKEAEMKEQEKIFKTEAKGKEKEIIALKNQKLQNELRHKSQDLASSTMNLIRKNEILLEMNKNLDKITDELNAKSDNLPDMVRKIEKMQAEIHKNIEHDNNWKKFQENFDLVYENYLKRLGEQFESLTVSDKKLCAYLKMDLSSKEIAPLLNMSYRSVEMSRYRLRKKLMLEREVNLTEYLQNF